MFRGYPGLNCVLAPRIHANVGVAGFDTKLRLPRDGISLRPLISAREGRKRKQHEQQRRGKPHISLLTSRTQHYSRVTDADTQIRSFGEHGSIEIARSRPSAPASARKTVHRAAPRSPRTPPRSRSSAPSETAPPPITDPAPKSPGTASGTSHRVGDNRRRMP